MKRNGKITFEAIYSSVVSGFPECYPFAEYYALDEKVFLYRDDYRNKVDAVAASLEESCAEVEKGRWIGLKYPTHVYWYAVFFALAKIGYKVMLLDDKASKKTLEHCIKMGDLAAVVGNSIDCSQEIKFIDFDDLVKAETGKPQQIQWESQMCFCTSGTTNLSKAIVFNAETLWRVQKNIRAKFFAADRMLDSMRGLPADGLRVLEVLPLRHVYAFQVSAIYWGFGCTLIFPKNEGIFEIAETIKRDKIWMTYSVPAFWKALFRVYEGKMGMAEPDSFREMFGEQFRYGMTGGARIDAEFKQKVVSTGLQFMNAFGSTETAAYVTLGFCNDEPVINVEGEYSGVRVNDHDIKVIAENGNLQTEGAGEMLLSGDNLYDGILRDGKYSERIEMFGEIFQTGDIFHITNGDFYYQGRADHMIINDEAENIYPEELEEELAVLEKRTEQFCVVGIEKEIALIINAVDGKDDLITLIKEINAKLPLYKRITVLYFVNERLPVTLKGEVSRKDMQEEIEKRRMVPGALEEIYLKGRRIRQA